MTDLGRGGRGVEGTTRRRPAVGPLYCHNCGGTIALHMAHKVTFDDTTAQPDQFLCERCWIKEFQVEVA
jgi:hypothetical protein